MPTRTLHIWVAIASTWTASGCTPPDVPPRVPLAPVESSTKAPRPPEGTTGIACQFEGTFTEVELRATPGGPEIGRVSGGWGTATLVAGPSPRMAVEFEAQGFQLHGYADPIFGLESARWVGPAGLQPGYPVTVEQSDPGRVAVRPLNLAWGDFELEEAHWLDCAALTPTWNFLEGEDFDAPPPKRVWQALGLPDSTALRRLPAGAEAELHNEPGGPTVAHARASFEPGRMTWVLEETPPFARVAFAVEGGVVVGWLDAAVLVSVPASEEDEEVWGGLTGTEVFEKEPPRPVCRVEVPTIVEARPADGHWQQIGTVLPNARFYRDSTELEDGRITPKHPDVSPLRGVAWRLKRGASLVCDEVDGTVNDIKTPGTP